MMLRMATSGIEPKRRPNWTEEERLTLVGEVKKREERLFGKFRGCGAKRGVAIKEEAWDETMAALNAKSSQIKRTLEEGKKQYANLKQRAKEKNDAIRFGPKQEEGPNQLPQQCQKLPSWRLWGGRATLNGLAGGIDTEDFDGIPCQLEEEPIVSMDFNDTNEHVLHSAINVLVMEDGILQIPTITAGTPKSTTVTTASTASPTPTATTATATTATATSNATYTSSVPPKKKLKLQQQEILTLQAEESKFKFEIVKLKEEAEFFRAKVALIELEPEKLKLEMEILRKQNRICEE